MIPPNRPQTCILKAREITFAWNIYWGMFALEIFLRVCGQFGSICRSIWQMKNSNKAHEMYSRNNLPQPQEETRNQFGKYLSALLEMHIKNACVSMTAKAHSEGENIATRHPGFALFLCRVKGRLASVRVFNNSFKSGLPHSKRRSRSFQINFILLLDL